MSLVATTSVTCPACQAEQEVEVVRSLNVEKSPELKARLLEGKLNLLVCAACGKRTQLQTEVLFHDPAHAYFCQVAVGGDAGMARATQAFTESGVSGTLRLVPSLNGLIEKVKLLDAGLDDWAIEMVKVLLLASIGERDLNVVLLFEGRENESLRWVLFDAQGGQPQVLTSPMAPYTRGVAQWASAKPPANEWRIDRVWAVETLRKVMPLPV